MRAKLALVVAQAVITLLIYALPLFLPAGIHAVVSRAVLAEFFLRFNGLALPAGSLVQERRPGA